MAKIGIVGSGSWGIALAVLLYNNGHHVSVWSALPEEITEMKTPSHSAGSGSSGWDDVYGKPGGGHEG